MAVFSRGAQITGQFADNRYRPFDDRHFYFIDCWVLFYFICNYFFKLLQIYDTQIKIDTYTFWTDGKMFFGSQASRLRNSPSRAESNFRISMRL